MIPKAHCFQATVYRIWMMRHVDIPEDVAAALEKESGKKNHIPVIAIVNGRSVRTTLFPAGGGRYRMQFNTELRKAARADAGDLVGLELRLDGESREMPLPPELSAVLKDHPKAWRAFEDLPPGHRRQVLLFYSRAKSKRARGKSALRIVDHLLERALLNPRKARPSKQSKLRRREK
jgi:hypothetical protein